MAGRCVVGEILGVGNIPLLTEASLRRGGRDIKKDGAKPPYLERTGWSLTSNVAGMHSETLRCERPPRLRRFGSFATFSYWRSHPSSVRRGLFA